MTQTTQTIHYHLPEGRKPSPLVQAFMEAADAAALLPPFMPDQPNDDDYDDDDDWQIGDSDDE